MEQATFTAVVYGVITADQGRVAGGGHFGPFEFAICFLALMAAATIVVGLVYLAAGPKGPPHA